MAAGVTLFYFTWKQETDVNFPFKIQIHTENHVKIMWPNSDTWRPLKTKRAAWLLYILLF